LIFFEVWVRGEWPLSRLFTAFPIERGEPGVYKVRVQ
jgi:hypothetical protein